MRALEIYICKKKKNIELEICNESHHVFFYVFKKKKEYCTGTVVSLHLQSQKRNTSTGTTTTSLLSFVFLPSLSFKSIITQS